MIGTIGAAPIIPAAKKDCVFTSLPQLEQYIFQFSCGSSRCLQADEVICTIVTSASL